MPEIQKLSTPCGYIGDGYTLEETIPEEPGVHPALCVTYRPMTSVERFAAGRAMAQHFPREPAAEVTEEQFAHLEREAAEQICRHAASWDLRDHKGVLVQLTPENILKMERHLSGKLYRLILGDQKQEEAAAKN